ncbi:MAG TPA: group II truncated hemoglobin [Fontimonas sp.]
MNATTTLFEALGGEPGIRGLVDAFYDRMDTEPAYAGIRALHPSSLDGSRDKLFWYLCGWSGGPQHFVERFGHPRLRARHLPFAIGESERDQWLQCMNDAMRLRALSSALTQSLLEAIVPLADWMRNRQG